MSLVCHGLKGGGGPPSKQTFPDKICRTFFGDSSRNASALVVHSIFPTGIDSCFVVAMVIKWMWLQCYRV